jgi:hypothetical protein
MGRGGGGGGKGGGGGGRGGRAGGASKGGGGGAAGAAGKADPAAPAAPAGAVDATAGQIYKESPSQMVQATQNFDTMMSGDVAKIDALYDDIPAPNVVTNAKGYKVVEPGTAGAPVVTNRLSANDAISTLQQRGVPLDNIRQMENVHGIEGVREIGSMIAQNPEAKWINSGMEGMVFNWSDSQIIRVQYNVGTPPPSYYVGKAGAYPQWKQTYKGVIVEGKEKVWDTIKRLEDQGYRNPVGARIQSQLQDIEASHGVGRWESRDILRAQTLDQYVKRVTNEARPGDAHANNWGVDFKGRLRVIDAGAYVPPGEMVTGQF